MTTTTVKSGSDAWVDEAKPSKNHGDQDFLKVRDPDQYAYVYLANPAPRRTAISSALLRLRAAAATTGSQVVSAQLVAGSWDQGRITWERQPDVVAGAISSTSVGALAEDDLIEIDVTAQMQSVSLGVKFYGWRITTDATTTLKLAAFSSGAHKPRLVVTYTFGPPVPASLTPSGVVSVAKPRLQFAVGHGASIGGIIALRIQIDPAGNFTTPDWDSGEVSSTLPEYALAGSSYPGLANGATTSWRVAVKGPDGAWLWSLPVTMTRVDFPSLTITNPGPPA